jgi:adenylate kinase
MSELNLILLGPPGAGKGTQAEQLRTEFELPHISTGDMLRQAVAEQTELGELASSYMDAGNLVPDDVIIGLLLEAIGRSDARDGFLLDGFPRTIPQAEALGVDLEKVGRKLTGVLLIEAPDEEIVRRISGRRVNPKSGQIYHVDFDPPKVEGIDDLDGSELVQREDDKPETVRNRLAVYHEQTAPLADYYENLGLLHRFDGSPAPAEVYSRIRGTIATLKLEETI